MAKVAEALNAGERAVDGSIASWVYPNSLDDALNNFAYHGTMSPGQAAGAALDVGVPVGPAKVAGQALDKIGTMNRWYQSPEPAKHMKAEMKHMFDNEGKSFREAAGTPLIQHRESIVNSTDYAPLPVDAIPNRPQMQQDFYQGATRLGWADDKLEGAATPVAKGQKPRAILVTGPAAAGKSAVANPIARQYNAAIVDPDEAKKMLPGFDDGMGANAVHAQSKAMTEQLTEELMRDRYNMVIPTVGSSPDKVLAKADQLRAAGYDVQLLNMDVAAEDAGQRMLLRSAGTGRHIPLDVFNKDAQGAVDTFGILRHNPKGAFDGVSQVANGPDVPRKGLKPVLMNSGILDAVPGLTI
jgi:predicted kinase